MSKQYDLYLNEHRSNVYAAFEWINNNIPEIFMENEKIRSSALHRCLYSHDVTKYDPEEYEAYDRFFYGQRNEKVIDEFDKAWLHHQRLNDHHWQYWVLHNDDPNEGVKVLDMPPDAIIEMVCDWWSFCFKRGDLRGIFSWYDSHKDYIMLSENTRKEVEYILGKIRRKLDEEEDMEE